MQNVSLPVFGRGFETYHHRQLVASVISLATRFLCSASKSHPALILLLLAPEPDSLRWIPVRIRDENIQIVHALQLRKCPKAMKRP